MADTDLKRLLIKTGIIFSLSACSFIAGYFSLQLTIGSAPVFDPRDILVVFAGALAGPVGGGLVGIFAGAGGSNPSVYLLLYCLGGTLTGFIARFLQAEKKWIPASVLGLGVCYPLAGLLMIAMGLWDRIAALAFQALIMQFTSILVLSIIGSLYPEIFSWKKDTKKGPVYSFP